MGCEMQKYCTNHDESKKSSIGEDIEEKVDEKAYALVTHSTLALQNILTMSARLEDC